MFENNPDNRSLEKLPQATFQCIVSAECPDLVRYFAKRYPACVNDTIRGYTPLEILISEQNTDFETMAILMQAGADCKPFDDARYDGECLIHLCLQANGAAIVDELLRAGVNTDLQGGNNRTLMEEALLRNIGTIITVLQNHGNVLECKWPTYMRLFEDVDRMISLISNRQWPSMPDPPSRWIIRDRGARMALEVHYLANTGYLSFAKEILHEIKLQRPRGSPWYYHERGVAGFYALTEVNFAPETRLRLNRLSNYIIAKEVFDVFVVLHELDLPALLLCELAQEMIGDCWPNIKMYTYWNIATAVKHFFDDAPEQPKKRRVISKD